MICPECKVSLDYHGTVDFENCLRSHAAHHAAQRKQKPVGDSASPSPQEDKSRSILTVKDRAGVTSTDVVSVQSADDREPVPVKDGYSPGQKKAAPSQPTSLGRPMTEFATREVGETVATEPAGGPIQPECTCAFLNIGCELHDNMAEAAPSQPEVDELNSAIEFAERVAPLPRCRHGKALRDGAGDWLEPSCGCRFPKDWEHNPKLAEAAPSQPQPNPAGGPYSHTRMEFEAAPSVQPERGKGKR